MYDFLVSNFGAHLYNGNVNPADCNICNNEVDTQTGLQCDTCDIWLHPHCVNVNNQELQTFEELDIPFLCSRCEWGENNPLDIEFDVFDGSEINLDLSIDDIDIQPILEPPSTSGLSIAHININGIDVEGRIDELRILFQNKPFDIIGINETKLTKDMPTDNFKINGYELLRADRKKSG